MKTFTDLTLEDLASYYEDLLQHRGIPDDTRTAYGWVVELARLLVAERRMYGYSGEPASHVARPRYFNLYLEGIDCSLTEAFRHLRYMYPNLSLSDTHWLLKACRGGECPLLAENVSERTLDMFKIDFPDLRLKAEEIKEDKA